MLSICLSIYVFAVVPVIAFAAVPAAKALPSLTGDQREDFVKIAESQIGYTENSAGSSVYGQFYGNTTAWFNSGMVIDPCIKIAVFKVALSKR